MSSDFQSDQKKMALLGRENFYFFARGILGLDWMVPHVHKPLCDFLSSPRLRKSIVLPRGFLKTTVCSTAFPIWRAIRDPDIRFLICQNRSDNAEKIVQAIRMVFEKNTLFQELYPEIIPDFRKVRWSNRAAEVNRKSGHPEATFEAAGVRTALTSRHYDVIMEDDIIAASKDDMTGIEAIPSRDEVDKAIGWHKLATSLLTNPKSGEIINVGTRWAKYDVIEHILTEQKDYYDFYHLSAIDPEGEPTYPERFDLETLRRIKADQGTYIYSTQYLNSPIDEDSMVFSPDWIKFYEVEPKEMNTYILVDPAISEKRKADYSCVMCVGVDGKKNIHVLEYTRKRMNPSALIDEIFSMAKRRSPLRVGIESVAWQQALAHFVKEQRSEREIFFRVEEIKPGPRESKDLRIRGLQPIAESGKLYIKKHHTELYQELLDFPYGAHDDVADTLAYIQRFAKYPGFRPESPAEVKGYTVGDMLNELRKRHSSNGSLPFSKQVI